MFGNNNEMPGGVEKISNPEIVNRAKAAIAEVFNGQNVRKCCGKSLDKQEVNA